MTKKKINDDTLLQLIRDGNSPAEFEKRISALEEMRNRGFYSVLRPHKRSAANLKHSSLGQSAQREPDHSEGSLRSRDIVV